MKRHRRPASKRVSAADAPSDQKRAGALNRLEITDDWNPPLAVRSRLG
jgi:hypothetical protein